MRREQRAWLALALAAVVLAGCADGSTPVPTATAQAGYVYGEAIVDEIDVLLLESFPVQVHVVAKGYLRDGCTQIDKVTQERKGNAFTVKIGTARPADKACTEALVPFEQVVALDVVGLKAGTYTVAVNGVPGGFELQMDNLVDKE